MSLSGWLRQAGLQRLRRERDGKRIDSVEALRAFFEACDSDADPGREPDWDEHLEVIQESHARGRPQP